MLDDYLLYACQWSRYWDYIVNESFRVIDKQADTLQCDACFDWGACYRSGKEHLCKYRGREGSEEEVNEWTTKVFCRW